MIFTSSWPWNLFSNWSNLNLKLFMSSIESAKFASFPCGFWTCFKLQVLFIEKTKSIICCMDCSFSLEGDHSMVSFRCQTGLLIPYRTWTGRKLFLNLGPKGYLNYKLFAGCCKSFRPVRLFICYQWHSIELMLHGWLWYFVQSANDVHYGFW